MMSTVLQIRKAYNSVKISTISNCTLNESVDMFIDKTGFSRTDVEPQRRFLDGLAAVNISDNSGNSEI